jgi:glycosyltransferase involved in cell wall biosynthesis
MRILVTPFTHPWPTVNGSRIRAAATVKALSELGDVDCFTIFDAKDDPIEGDPTVPPPGSGATRSAAVPRGRVRGRRSRGDQLRWFLQSDLPAQFYGRDFGAPRAAFRGWSQEPYDLVWFHGLETYLTLGPEIDAPVIMDLDVLLDQWIVERLASERADGRRRSLRHRVQAILAGKNVRQFQRLHHRVASRVERILVTNEDDLLTLGEPNGVVVPNGFEAPVWPAGKLEVGSPPVILFQANLTRPPKIVASEYLIDRIAPLIWQQLPDARIRLAGKADPSLARYSDPPRVVLTGFVPDMADELALADIAVVPVRFAGGTLLKVLENFAHRVPVVSTSIGARGLGVRHDEHLLIADTPTEFADACVRLLNDIDLRRRLVDAAHELFLQRFQWSAIHEQMRGLARAAIEGRRQA